MGGGLRHQRVRTQKVRDVVNTGRDWGFGGRCGVPQSGKSFLIPVPESRPARGLRLRHCPRARAPRGSRPGRQAPGLVSNLNPAFLHSSSGVMRVGCPFQVCLQPLSGAILRHRTRAAEIPGEASDHWWRQGLIRLPPAVSSTARRFPDSRSSGGNHPYFAISRDTPVLYSLSTL